MNLKRLLLGIIIATFLLRIPTFFDPHWYFDEGIYATVGSQWLKGSKLYTNIWDHKPPGLFLIYGLACLLERTSTIDILFWARLLACLAVILTQIALYKIARRLFNHQKVLSLSIGNLKFGTWIFFTPVFLYGLLTSLPFWEGYMANGEIFESVFGTWGIFFLVKNLNSKTRNYLTAGLLLGTAALIKPVAIAEIILGYLVILKSCQHQKAVPKHPKRTQNKLRRPLGVYTLGLIIPLVIAGIYFLAQRSLGDFIYANIIYNLKYTSSNPATFEEEIVFNFLRIIAFSTAIYLLWQKKELSPAAISLGWLILAVISATLSLRPYTHYLVQLFPPLCLLSTTAFGIKTAKVSHCLLPVVWCLLILIPLNQRIKLTENIPYQFNQFNYFQNFLSRVTGNKTSQEYINFFGHNVASNQKILDRLASLEEMLITNHSVFIWGGGEAPWLYYDLSQLGLKPATRFTNYFHAEANPEGIEETIKSLRENPPSFIIIFPSAPRFEELKKLVNQLYLPVENFQEAAIYLKAQNLEPGIQS
ncbi:hypothetical protein B5M47_03565 [candidate division CPR3 bacterium 4484_211]|uniref:Glycosyltransferase RgtA/B/C/D-like domain-containing protein n=1 Tax=candidate division CPR3 bacterium 4484_211 TaxID=1968527 RepID=A0A1W9NX43_UNCC3|nr:MAG: hypothetical protein B5M47_03565 [candidate division CPR3 bacterium 4484_211]